jgi:Raf kinase inhibitor-like YbhB/YbcL family protein
MNTLSITSPAFSHNTSIPVKYTCDGDNVSPPLVFSEVPEGTKSLVLIVDDPDAPVGTWDHWIVFNIQSSVGEMEENREPDGTGGNNSWGRPGWGGPCPPSGEHRYFFKLYALDTMLDLPEGATKAEVETAMGEHILARGELVGVYTRQ